MSKKKVFVIEDWEQFQLKLNIALIVNDEAKEKKTPRAIWEERLKKHEIDVIQFKAKVKAKDLGGGHTTGPHRIEIPKNIYLELGKWVEVFIVKEEK